MNVFLMILFPLLFFSVAAFGAKPAGKGQWNDDYLGLKQMKALQGFSALGIMLHHMAQKTAAEWLDPSYIHHGLDMFVSIGTFFVSVFLFSSGYGLYQSLKIKENYLKGFFGRRCGPILLMYVIAALIFYLAGHTANPYTWYIAAILYFYLVFYLAFRYCKSDGAAIAVLAVGTVLYIAVLDVLMFGTWWYNTAGMFLLGVLCAKYQKSLTAMFKKRYLPLLLIGIGLMFGCFFTANSLNERVNLFETSTPAAYHLTRIAVILGQYLSSAAFVFVCLMIVLKIRIGNRVLDFLGAMSLELYLIHGIFVQAFSYCYISEDTKPLYYIRSVPLYVLVVLVCSVAAAFVLKLARKYLLMLFAAFARSERDFLVSLRRDLKKAAIILPLLVLVPTVIFCVGQVSSRKEQQEKIAAYEQEYLRFVEVDGKQMAVYLTGEETAVNTLVFMRGYYDPCPTMTLRALADSLADKYRVIVPDYFGSGSSDTADTPRTAENITNEVHELVQNLGVTGKYVLVAEAVSGLYAVNYVNQYPDEVQAIIGLDAYTEPLWETEYSEQRAPLMDYQRMTTVRSVLYHAGMKAVYKTGLDVFAGSSVSGFFAKGFGLSELDFPTEQFIAHYMNKASAEELKQEYYSYLLVRGMKIPKGIRFTDMRSINTLSDMGVRKQKIGGINAGLCEDAAADYEIVTVSNLMWYACGVPDMMHKMIDDALGQIEHTADE